MKHRRQLEEALKKATDEQKTVLQKVAETFHDNSLGKLGDTPQDKVVLGKGATASVFRNLEPTRYLRKSRQKVRGELVCVRRVGGDELVCGVLVCGE